jgi:hypothetical protein
VGTLQNVAVISSMQIVPVDVPVVVPVEVLDAVPVFVLIEEPAVVPVATCAAAGGVAQSSDVSSAVINPSCFMCALVLR